MVSDERRAEVERIVQVITAWARSCDDVRAVAVVGSWARHDARMDSDLDVVVLTDATWRYVESDDWIASAVGEWASVSRQKDWGPLLKERRLLLGSGLEIEFGFAPLSWASTDPLDAGTAC
jgi:predicted nucleotidyltransferase